ncbi:bidirectional sugar transporter SWEET12-like [Tripterygium wilfordii]|uniref:Bidirectional sugar transporter SWEET n=1 Tax=Tripterygium wilfordii TaxID=458696 RepID=A0A7J7DBM3_TRIWF|nr:bidirectional sugar transporter SWEET12-like [Tripterygium wilfordii]
MGNILEYCRPTFVRVVKKKSTEGFQSYPYMVSLISAMIWIYYASLKSNEYLLITINSFGCVTETIYIAIFIAYAPKQVKMPTLRLVILLNFGGFCLILLVSHYFLKGAKRLEVLGWLCDAFAVGVFAAPLSIMKKVIQTKSVEFMPFYLSFFLTLSAVMWFFYGFLMKDLFVAVPNTLGFLFGVAQMSLYAVYKNYKKKLPAVAEVLEPQLQELSEHIVDVVKLSAMVCPHELISAVMVNINMGTEKVEVENEVIKEEITKV